MLKIDAPANPTIMDVRDDFDELIEHVGTLAESPNSKHITKLAANKQIEATQGTSTYVLSFFIDVTKAMLSSAQIVQVSAYSAEGESAQSLNPASLIESIQTKSIKLKGAAGNDGLKLIGSTAVDVTTKVNNEFVKSIASDGSVELTFRSKRVTLVSNKDLIDAHQNLPLIEGTTLSSDEIRPSNFTPKESAHELIMLGIDPSAVANFDARISSSDALAAVAVAHGKAPNHKAGDVLRARYLMFTGPKTSIGKSSLEFDASALLPTAMLEIQRYARFEAILSIPSNVLGNKFIVRFTLIGTNGAPVQTISRYIDHAENLRLFDTPTMPPVVSISRPMHEVGKTYAIIKQADTRASSIEVYHKRINSVSKQVEPYTKLATVSAPAGVEVAFPIDVDTADPVIVRCIPVGVTGHRSTAFGSAIVRSSRASSILPSSRTHALSLIARIDERGILVEIRDIPAATAAVTIQRRDASVWRSNFITIADTALANESSLQPISFVDDSVKGGRVYEYRCMLIDRFGSSSIGSSMTVEYVPLSSNLIDTAIENQLVTAIADDNIDVTFDIHSRIVDGKLQLLKQLLDDAGLFDLFKGEVQNERELLDSVIAHQVMRYDLTDGFLESFGVITGEVFSDKGLGKIHSVRPLRRGHAYRYEVYPLLRSIETMLEKLKQQTEEKGKTFNFKPSKFKHPLALTEGNLSSPESRERNHARDELSFGRVGTITSLDISLGQQAASVTDIDARLLASRRLSLRWRTGAPPSSFDHFIIMREMFGVRSFVAAAAHVSDSGTYQLLHDLTDDDIGVLRYVVLPIMNDYSLGQEATSNLVEVK